MEIKELWYRIILYGRGNVKEKMYKLLDKIKFLLPVLLFLWMTYVVFVPSSILLSNIDEFQMHYIYILPSVVIVSILVMGIAAVVGGLCGKKFLPYYFTLLFSITLCMYIQSNFLNPPFRVLDGVEVEWQKYSVWNVVSICVWTGIIVAAITLCYFKTDVWIRVAKMLSLFISGVQLLSLLFLIITTELGSDSYGRFAFVKEDEFSIGTDRNIVVFVLDSLQVDAMQKYCTTNGEELEDFTFFTNTVSGGAPTHGAMPVLLTGIEYDPMESRNEYELEIWNQTHIYSDLKDQGYDIRFFTSDATAGMPEGYITGYEKISTAVVSNHREFIKNMYRLVDYIVLPQELKKFFAVSTEDITDNIGTYDVKERTEDLYYDFDDVRFYQELYNSELDLKYEKAFRLYHLNGAHPPFTMNENIERVQKDNTSEEQQIEGAMKIVNTYIGKLKQKGLYDDTTIIITGDHGQHENGNLMINPAILVKRVDETHSIVYNSNPVCFRNLVATIMEQAGVDYYDYGPSLYDISENSDIERLHTFPVGLFEEDNIDTNDCWKDSEWYRIAVDQEGHVSTWNPYARNYIEYKLGDTISFKDSEGYGDRIQERVYRKGDEILLSNEFTMCLAVENIPITDMNLDIEVTEVYNNSQTARIYVNGQYLQEWAFTSDMIGSNIGIKIPKNMIQDTMVIRMVFPGAVTPKMLDADSTDERVLSIGISSIKLDK